MIQASTSGSDPQPTHPTIVRDGPRPDTPLLSVNGPPGGVRRARPGRPGRPRPVVRDPGPARRSASSASRARARASARCRCSACCRSGSAGSRPGARVFEGQELLHLPEDKLRKIRGARIAMIFQDPLSSLNPVLTIGRQITEAIETHRGVSHEAGPQARDRAARARRHPRAPRRGSTTIRTSSAAACASAR